MQKRSSVPHRIQYSPVELEADFPVRLLGLHSPSPEPADYLHQHDCLEIGYCHSGAGVFMVGDKIMPFRAGDVSVINDREMHGARSAAGEESLWSFLLLDPGRLLLSVSADRQVLRMVPLGGSSFRNIIDSGLHPEISGMVKLIVEELRAGKRHYQSVVRGQVLVLMALLHRLVAGRYQVDDAERGAGTERIAPALGYMARNYDRRIAVGTLAKMCFTSESNFRRLFRSVTGRSPKEYLVYLRIQMATALLQNSGMSVLEVSANVGYRTLSSFNRHFRRIMDCSPRQWRKAAPGSEH